MTSHDLTGGHTLTYLQLDFQPARPQQSLIYHVFPVGHANQQNVVQLLYTIHLEGEGPGNKGEGPGNKEVGSGNKGARPGNKGAGPGNKGEGSGNKGEGSGNKGRGLALNKSQVLSQTANTCFQCTGL